MVVYRFLASVATLSAVGYPIAASAQVASERCWRADELDSVRVHDFKLMLMAGALNCRGRVPGMLQSYNDFIDSKRDYIVANQYVVRAHFVRVDGPVGGGKAYTNYETSIGNQYSNKAYGPSKCEMLGAFARMAADADEEDVPHLARGLAGAPEHRLCPARLRVASVRPRPYDAEVSAALVAPTRPGLTRAGSPTARTAALIASARNGRLRPAAVPAVRFTAPTPALRPATAAPVEAPEPINEGPPEVAVVPEPMPASAVAKPTPAIVPVEAAPAGKPEPAASVSAAQALAEAAKSLAAAAAAMQAQPAVAID